jgi:hypothetical protein
MARRNRPAKEQVDSAKSKIDGLLTSPLRAIGESLGWDLDEAECAYRGGKLLSDKLSEPLFVCFLHH